MTSVDGYKSCDYESHELLSRQNTVMKKALEDISTKQMWKSEMISIAKEAIKEIT